MWGGSLGHQWRPGHHSFPLVPIFHHSLWSWNVHSVPLLNDVLPTLSLSSMFMSFSNCPCKIIFARPVEQTSTKKLNAGLFVDLIKLDLILLYNISTVRMQFYDKTHGFFKCFWYCLHVSRKWGMRFTLNQWEYDCYR